MKVKASRDFQFYRLAVFGGESEMKKEDYRGLQAGKEVEVSESLIKKYPNIFEVDKPPKKKEVKDGN
jgi:hypothetical protein